jgi:Na+-transporting methylmalonyl-CoA/oxaloacetate decarboxylase gamma subunit
MDNIGFGLWMTGTGMSIVFGMLALLMGLLALMGRLDRTKVPAISSAHDGTPAVTGEPSPCHSLSERGNSEF